MNLAISIGRWLAPALLASFALGSGVPVCSAADDGDGAARSQAKVLTVCALPASMPRSDRAADGTPRGIDVAVGQAGRTSAWAGCRVPLVCECGLRVALPP